MIGGCAKRVGGQTEIKLVRWGARRYWDQLG